MVIENYEFHNLSCHSILLEGNNDDDEDADKVKQSGKKGELISETRPG